MGYYLPSVREAGLLLLCGVVLFLPTFVAGAGGVDLHTQSLWSKAFADQFYQGELYPRWLMGLFAGAGSPAFFYNPPLPYFLTLPFYPFHHTDPFGYAPLALSSMLAVLLSCIAMHAWLRDLGLARSVAMAGSLLYLLAPNHVAQNFYELLLFASVWAYVPLPLLFLFARRLGLGQPGGVAGYALTLALLVLIHLPSVILFGPLSVIYLGVCLPGAQTARRLARSAGAVALGFALSAIFLLPCLAYLPYVAAGMDHWGLPDGKSYETSRFFFGFSSTQALAYQLYWLASAVLTAALVRPARQIEGGRFFLAACIGALVLMLPFTAPLWQHVPLLRYVQLAERLFMVTTLTQAVLLAQCWPRWRTAIIAILGVCAIVTVVAAFNGRTPTIEAFNQAHPERAQSYRMKIEQYPGNLGDPDLVLRYGNPEGQAKIQADRQRLRIITGKGNADVTKWRPRNIEVKLAMQSAGTLRIRQFAYYGFAATLDGEPLPLGRDGTTGFLLAEVPAGEHVLSITLQKLLPEKLGMAISMLALAGWLLLVLAGSKRK